MRLASSLLLSVRKSGAPELQPSAFGGVQLLPAGSRDPGAASRSFAKRWHCQASGRPLSAWPLRIFEFSSSSACRGTGGSPNWWARCSADVTRTRPSACAPARWSWSSRRFWPYAAGTPGNLEDSQTDLFGSLKRHEHERGSVM